MVYFSEFLGSLILLAGGYSYGANTSLKKTFVNQMSFVDCFLAWGSSVGLAMSIAVALGGPAYVNPGVVFGNMILGNITVGEAGMFLLMEFLGAGAAVGLVTLFFWDNFKSTPDTSKRGIFAAYPVEKNIPRNFFQEIICTFVFLFLFFLAICNPDCNVFQINLVGIFVLLYIAYTFSVTGFSMNAMRSVFSSIWYTVLPVPNKNDRVNWNYQIIVNFFGSSLGGILAVIAALKIRGML